MTAPQHPRRFQLVLLILLFALFLSGCSGPGIYGLTVIAEDQLIVGADERLYGNVVLIDGQLQMEQQSELFGNLYIAGGRAGINGTVHGNIILLLGDLALDEHARLEGDLSFSAGNLSIDPQAVVLGDVSTAETIAEMFAPDEREESSALGWFLPLGLLYVLFTYVFVRYRPRPVQRIRVVFQEHSLVALAMGLLGWVVLPSLLLLMISTFVLLPVALLLGFVLLLTILFGWIAFSLLLGERLAGLSNRPLSPQLSATAGAVLLLVGLYLVGLIPVLNLFTTGLLATLSLGAILLTRFGLTTFSPPVDNTPDELFSPPS
jgi:hypothetical protein